MRNKLNLGASPFPKIARGHASQSVQKNQEGKGCLPQCSAQRRTHAHYTSDGTYVDGHFTDQATAERAHAEGYR